MANGVETTLLEQLRAMQAQKAAFDSEAKRLVDQCLPEHAESHNGKEKSGEDVDMMDAPGEPEVPTAANLAVSATSQPTAASSTTSNGHGASQKSLCRPCFNNLITLIHNTYATPSLPSASFKQALWYAGSEQDTFLTELDRILDDVRNLRAPLQNVDNWIAAQKQVWLHNQLQAAAALQALGNTPAAEGEVKGKTDLQTLLADLSGDLSGLLGAVADKAGGDKDRVLSDAKAAVKKLLMQQQQAQSAGGGEQGVVYRDSLFPSGVPDLPEARAIEKKMLDGEVGLDQGLSEVLRDIVGDDNEDGRAAKIDKHRKRLAELRRAKAAHEAQKLKKMKQVDVPYFLSDEASCATCSKACDPQKSPFCNICFLEVDYCLRENQTVWCSNACMRKTYTKHFADNHPCKAGDRCTRARQDSDSMRQDPRYCFCRECVLSFSKSTVYCSDRCAGRDFQSHRETVHLPKRRMHGDFHDDQDELSYSSFAKKDYTAADISRHVMTMEEAFTSCQKKHPDWDMTETKVQMNL